MAETPSPDIRIGDIEREEALRALGEHMSIGRLDIDEYGERAAKATAAKTRGELALLFTDLPQPHRIPVTASGEPASYAAADAEPARPPARRGRQPGSAVQRIAPALVPLSGLLAIVLFFSIDGMPWLIFLLPAAMAIIVGMVLGDDRRTRR